MLRQQFPQEDNCEFERVSFAWLSDTHAPDRENYEAYGVKIMPRVRAVNELILEHQRDHGDLDALINTGDVCDVNGLGNKASYSKHNSDLEMLKLPKYFVAGNHDQPHLMTEHLDFGKHINDYHVKDRLCYSFKIGSIECFVLDARIDQKPRGYIEPEQLDWLDQQLAQLKPGDQAPIFLHYPLFNTDTEWIKKRMLVENGEEVHRRLVKNKDHILGVFHGHIHASTSTTRDGITYISCSAASYPMKLDNAKDANESLPVIDPNGKVGFNILSITKSESGISFSVRTKNTNLN